MEFYVFLVLTLGTIHHEASQKQLADFRSFQSQTGRRKLLLFSKFNCISRGNSEMIMVELSVTHKCILSLHNVGHATNLVNAIYFRPKTTNCWPWCWIRRNINASKVSIDIAKLTQERYQNYYWTMQADFISSLLTNIRNSWHFNAVCGLACRFILQRHNLKVESVLFDLCNSKIAWKIWL